MSEITIIIIGGPAVFSYKYEKNLRIMTFSSWHGGKSQYILDIVRISKKSSISDLLADIQKTFINICFSGKNRFKQAEENGVSLPHFSANIRMHKKVMNSKIGVQFIRHQIGVTNTFLLDKMYDLHAPYEIHRRKKRTSLLKCSLKTEHDCRIINQGIAKSAFKVA